MKLSYVICGILLVVCTLDARPAHRTRTSRRDAPAGIASGFAGSVQWTHLSSSTGDLPSPNGGTEQTACLVFDVDGDGVNDFVIAERTAAPSVVWYRRTAGGWTKYVIENPVLMVEAGGAFYDIDGDGDIDVVFGGDWRSNEVWWWENPSPAFDPSTPWTKHVIKNSGGNQHHDEVFGDFKGDGKTELVFWNQGASTLYLANIPANPRTAGPWTLEPIFNFTGSAYEGLTKADIDGDGIDDIVGGGNWFKYNGDGTFTAFPIDNAMTSSRVSAGQLIPGGRPEVVFQAGDWDGPLNWYQWDGSAWVAHQLNAAVLHGHSLQVADLNGDGKLDIFSAEMRLNGGNANAKMRIYYGDAAGNFRMTEMATGIGNHESRVADLNGDGRPDILDKPYNWNTPRIDVWLNNGTVPFGSPGQWTYILADNSRAPSPFGNGMFGLGFGDLNNDGFVDIASGGYFYRNPGGDMSSSPWPRVTLPSDPSTGKMVDAGLLFDAEGSGTTNDILAEDLPNIVWMKAGDAQGNSWTPKVVAQVPVTAHGNGRTIRQAHLIPGNTKPDILLSGADGVYLLQVPANPETDTWPLTKITTSAGGEQKSIGIGDINRDGTLDIVTTVGADMYEIDWWSNPGDSSPNWTKHVVGSTDHIAKMLEVADINGDGRADIMATEEARPANVYWFEAPADPNGTWTRHTVVTGLEELDSMTGLDMNHDGQPDIVVGEIFGAQRVIIFENRNHGASWVQFTADSGKESHNGVRAVDLDNDGNPEIVSIAYFDYSKLHIWRNDGAAVEPAAGEMFVDRTYSSYVAGGHYWDYDAASSIQVAADLVAPGGTVRMLGGTYNESVTTAKNIVLSPYTEAAVQNLNLTGNSHVSLGNSLVVSGTLGLASGKLFLNGNSLTVASPDGISGGSSSSFVVTGSSSAVRPNAYGGSLVIQGITDNAMGTFPVGSVGASSDTFYTPVTLRQTSSATPRTYSVSARTPLFPPNEDEADALRHSWVVLQSSPDASVNVDMTLQWGSLSEEGAMFSYFFNPASGSRSPVLFEAWRNSAGSWVRQTGALQGLSDLVSRHYPVYASVRVPVGNAASAWTLALADAVLPIQLASFTGHEVPGKGVLLEWSTASEAHNLGFSVLRGTSQDSIFTELPGSFVHGHGTTNEPQHYNWNDSTATHGEWFYRLRQTDLDGTIHFSELIRVAVLTGAQEAAAPSVFALMQNYPNPFNPVTVVKYTIGEVGGRKSDVNHVSLKVFDLLGREVATLVNEPMAPGEYAVRFDASGQASGVYFYRLQAGGYVATKKLVVLR